MYIKLAIVTGDELTCYATMAVPKFVLASENVIYLILLLFAHALGSHIQHIIAKTKVESLYLRVISSMALYIVFQ